MTLFYYGLETSGADKKLGGGEIENACFSASILWDRRRGRFRKWVRPRIKRLGIDSGGFHRATREHGFPFTPGDLAALSAELRPEWVATLDFPCEPGVLRPQRETNAQRIEATARNAGECLGEAGPPWLPVVQGYTPEEYRYCVELLEAEHAVRPYMAVGTLCARKTVRQTRDVLRAVRRMLPDVRLHGFGVDLRLLRDREIQAMLYSADSQAWHFSSGSGILPEGHRMAGTDDEKVAAFADYRRRVERILGAPSVTLGAFA